MWTALTMPSAASMDVPMCVREQVPGLLLLLRTLFARFRQQTLKLLTRCNLLDPNLPRRFSRNPRFKGNLPRKTLGHNSHKLQGDLSRRLILGHNSSKGQGNSNNSQGNLSNNKTMFARLTTMQMLLANPLFGVQVL